MSVVGVVTNICVLKKKKTEEKRRIGEIMDTLAFNYNSRKKFVKLLLEQWFVDMLSVSALHILVYREFYTNRTMYLI